MRRYFLTAAAAALTFIHPAAVAQGDAEFQKLAPAVQAATNRGALLYLYDEAAWHGTDDIRDNFPELLKLAGGYVVSGTQADTELVFYDKAKTAAVYRAKFENEKLVTSGPPTPDRLALTDLEKRMIAAKETALSAFSDAKVTMCAEESPNIAALPPETEGGPLIVYLMTPRTSMKSLPFGGHYSVEVRQNGTTGEVRRFTKSCIELSMEGERKNEHVAGLYISHLLDPVPTEIHVFTSMSGKIPIYVITTSNGRTWAVEGSSVRTVANSKKK